MGTCEACSGQTGEYCHDCLMQEEAAVKANFAKLQAEVERLRKLEGTDAPEHRCDRCSGRNISSWYADSDVWNRVAGDYSILCPICFSELAREAGVVTTAWRLSMEGDDPEISKLRVRFHDSLNEAAKLGARVAQLEHQAECYWYEIATGEWALDHCEECKGLDEIVKNTAKLGESDD